MCYSFDRQAGRAASRSRRRTSVLLVWPLVVATATSALGWPTAIDGLVHASDRANSVAVDAAGDVIATGVTNDLNGGLFAGSFPVVKLDGGTGSLVWRRDLAGTNVGFGDLGNKVVLDPSGDVVAAGYATNDVTFFDFTVAKLANATGAVIWRANVNGGAQGGSLTYDQARDVVIDPNGDVLAAGGLMETGTFIASDFAVVKLDGATGAELWRASINGTSGSDPEDYANAVATDAAGNAIAAGTIKATVGGSQFSIAKFAAANGALLWRRDFHEQYVDYAVDVAVDAAGDAVAVGQVAYRGFVTKVRGTDGTVAWQRSLAGTGSIASTAYETAVDADGDAYVVGSAFNLYSGNDLVVWKLSGTDGHELWRRAVTGLEYASSYDYGIGIALDGMGNVAVGGSLEHQFTVLRLRASDGTELMRRSFPPPAEGYGDASHVAFDPAGNIIAAGAFEDESTGTEADFFVTKVPADGPIEGCGNGIVEAPEWCDDGNDSSTDACLPACLPNFCVDGVAITGVKLKVRKGTVALDGTLAFGTSGVPGGFAPSIRGAQLLLETPADFQQPNYVTLASWTDPIPPAAAGACGPGDRWSGSNGTGIYRNASGAIDPPTCTPGSAAGLVSLRLVDRSTAGGGVRFKAKLRGLAALPNGPLRVTLVLGAAASDATSGVCGIVQLTEAQCQVKPTSYRCKS